MERLKIDGEMLKNMMISGANALDQHRAEVDALNVFPVPDGDTGTNMSLTFLAAAREAEKLQDPTVHAVAKAISSGSLRGARGNSGVILSQLFRGFAKGLEGCDEADVDDITNAFSKAFETSYKAVMKPKEGTILTIAKAMADKAFEEAFDTGDVAVLLAGIIQHAQSVLLKTTEMLPALKQANVVDAGGQGLLYIWEAALRCLTGHTEAYVPAPAQSVPQREQHDFSALAGLSTEDIQFGYCTEFFICTPNATETTENDLKAYLETIGDSIVAVADDQLIKIHVHTNNPGAVLEKALAIGYLDSIKIENMRVQHTSILGIAQHSDANDNGNASPAQPVPVYEQEFQRQALHKGVGFIVVSAGAGFKELFESFGADLVIEGGQTMNPSTEDFIAAINSLEAENVILMPNNKNIILAAKQATHLIEDKNIFVLPTKSLPQGLSALINYTDAMTVAENIAEMEELIRHVKTGQITYAVRATTLGDQVIEEGDILCMIDGKIEHVAKSLQQGAKALLDMMLDGDTEVISIFYGEGATEEMAQELLDYVNKNHPDMEAEIQNGGQPVYHYIISAE